MRYHRLFNTYTGPTFRVYTKDGVVEVDPAPPFGSLVLRNVPADSGNAEDIKKARKLAAVLAAKAAEYSGLLLGAVARRALDDAA